MLKTRSTVRILFFLCIASIVFGQQILPVGRKSRGPRVQQNLPGSSAHGVLRIGEQSAIKLEGSLSMGLYYITLGIGTPAQLMQLHVDTGSSTTAVSDSTCSVCGDPPFYSSRSSTFESCYSDCSFTLRYGDGSYASGVAATDVITMGSAAAPSRFGLITSQSPDFEPDPLDGILGLAYPSLAVKGMLSPFDALVSTGQFENQFSMCLNPQGGVMVLGGLGNFHSGEYVWIPEVTRSNPGFYMIPTLDVAFGGHSVSSSPVNAIVDSGSTAFVVPTNMFNAIRNLFLSQYPSLPGISGTQNLFNGYCVTMTASQAAAFPQLSIALNGITLTVTGAEYVRPVEYRGRTYKRLRWTTSEAVPRT